ncbi:phage holin family protein [Patescibacteria group bacterium]|nr:phage holin family protein [Patescibacteria group bacterium]
MRHLILQIIAGVLGLFLATKFVRGVEFTGSFQVLLLSGLVLGLINFFIKPILKKIFLPLRILTFGLFTLIINMGMVWIVDFIFPELKISGITSFFWTIIIVWGLSVIVSIFIKK